MLTKLMIEIARLDHVSFAVQDVDASRRFFGAVLGLPEIDRPPSIFAGPGSASATARCTDRAGNG
jgi:catechol 2,3-dioxygenase-like lactoylglutathione lyase family enzyme